MVDLLKLYFFISECIKERHQNIIPVVALGDEGFYELLNINTQMFNCFLPQNASGSVVCIVSRWFDFCHKRFYIIQMKDRRNFEIRFVLSKCMRESSAQ